MDALKNRIITDGKILDGDILKVDSFLNHQIDVTFLNEIGTAFKERFKEGPETRLLSNFRSFSLLFPKYQCKILYTSSRRRSPSLNDEFSTPFDLASQ